LVKANQSPQNLFWLRRINDEIEGEPKLRDVCQACNNGVLSALDNYICALFDRYFVHVLNRFDRVRFEFDYHLLKRWLLKMCFNSARMHSSLDLIAYPALLPYVCGHSTAAGRSVQLYLQLCYPGVVPPEHLAQPNLRDAPVIWEPQDNRVGFLYFQVPEVGSKVLRAVHLRSYSFYLAFFEPSAKASIAADFAKEFLAKIRATVLLLASRQKTDLVCDGQDAWKSYEGSRETSIVSTGDKSGAV
jgi:hypothetical protein